MSELNVKGNRVTNSHTNNGVVLSFLEFGEIIKSAKFQENSHVCHVTFKVVTGRQVKYELQIPVI